MVARPLLIASLLEHAARYHASTEIVSETVEGPRYRSTYAATARRTRQLANALQRLGVRPGDRIATLAWNTHRHFELYFAISGIGAICHTVNPRLSAEHLIYIFNHAADRVIFVDLTFLPLVEKLREHLPKLQTVVVLTDRDHMPQGSALTCYESILEPESVMFDWPELDENTDSSLCYTSGTTGQPKGSMYSHRSTVLHTFACCAGKDGVSTGDVVCPVVPMFHVNAWGTPYAVAMSGAKLVLNGPRFDPDALYRLFEEEKVTKSQGVPTIWQGLLKFLDATGKRFTTLRTVLIGGAALPPAMIAALETRYGITTLQGWGMTEMSPLGTVSVLKPQHLADEATRLAQIAKQGLCLWGIDYRLMDEAGHELPQDGHARGELQVRGHWVISSYYNDMEATANAFEEGGWFRTGDIATIDEDGYLQIVDRSKDLVKSGGEWISSVDVENAAMAHPAVAEAAVVAIPDAKWGERPLLCIVRRDGQTVTDAEVIEFIRPKLAAYAVPDHVVFLNELPHGATGKVYKLKLREMFREFSPQKA